MRRIRIGPGVLIAAAFIGPGTVTTATVVGAEHGYVLGWGIVFSIFATIVLQEMAARLGVVGRVGLGQAIRRRVPPGMPFLLAASLVIAAIFIGNIAYEGGNLSGAAAGLTLLPGLDSNTGFDVSPQQLFVLALGLLAFGMLWLGSFDLLKKVLTVLVLMLTLAYAWAAVEVNVDWSALLRGLLPLRLPSGAELSLIALVGTTVVPYNLFLHADAAKSHYGSADDLSAARTDTSVSVILGGLVTLLISALAAATFGGSGSTVTNAAQLAEPLGVSLGHAAPIVVGVGLLAAGLTSAITAPLAAAYALAGILGWPIQLRERRFRLAWITVLLAGILFSVAGIRPVPLILIAQAANGILLPVIAGFLVWAANDQRILGDAVNSPARNTMAFLVVLITVGLAVKTLIGLL